MKIIILFVVYILANSAIAADFPLRIKWEIVVHENGVVLKPWKEITGTFTEISQLVLQCETETGKLCLARKKK